MENRLLLEIFFQFIQSSIGSRFLSGAGQILVSNHLINSLLPLAEATEILNLSFGNKWKLNCGFLDPLEFYCSTQQSSNTENNEQQYVEIGSNIYLGTKDGIKYSLIQSSDNKLRLVEAPSDSSVSLSDSSGSFETPQAYESSNISSIQWSESLNESKEIKIISLKSEPSPCKGQGDEIGNTVISPRNISASFEKIDYVNLENSKQELIAGNANTSSVLTYTTLYPKQQEKGPVVTYYVNPSNSFNSYSPVFPSPVNVRPTRYARRGRMPFMPPDSPYTPIPRVRRGAPRMRRPRQSTYKYTPQILHSTPTNSTNISYGSDSSLSLSGCSSGSLSGSSLIKSQSSIEYPRVPNNTPASPNTEPVENQKTFSLEWMPFIENFTSLNSREAHNEKERHRRLRIKNACQSMRCFMPWLDEKTDNATIFEEAVNYITFLRGVTGGEHDIEFMEQHYLY